MTGVVRLPGADGAVYDHVPSAPRAWSRPERAFTSRTAFAAAHVAGRVGAENVPNAPAVIDWDATLAFREHLWSYGFGVAEAMDTAQRGMGLDWAATQELIRRSAAAARAVGGRIAAGAGTDHRTDVASVDDVVSAYEEQLEVVEASGAQVIVMASRALAAVADGPDDYAKVYARVLEQAARPVIVHWLGPMFDPALAGYWGSDDIAAATAAFVDVISAHTAKVDGVKVSLLDAEHERRLRELLPPSVRIYTGDDFNYPELIRGGSDALLGVFAAIAPVASAALQRLDAGDESGYAELLDATLPLARHLFCAPTFNYKVGIAFLAWLGGHQPGFVMAGGLQSARSASHLATAYRLADDLNLFPDPNLAVQRMRAYLTVCGVPQ